MRSHVVAFVSHEDDVDFLFEQLFQEEIVAPVRARSYQMEVINHEQKVRIRVLVKRL